MNRYCKSTFFYVKKITIKFHNFTAVMVFDKKYSQHIFGRKNVQVKNDQGKNTKISTKYNNIMKK